MPIIAGVIILLGFIVAPWAMSFTVVTWFLWVLPCTILGSYFTFHGLVELYLSNSHWIASEAMATLCWIAFWGWFRVVRKLFNQ